MYSLVILVLALAVIAVRCEGNDLDWKVGVDHVRPSGTILQGHANIPIHSGADGRLDGNVRGSRIIGGPYNGDYSAGGGLKYEHNSGLHAGVDAIHRSGQGNTYSARVGGSRQLGPGTLSIDGGAVQTPYSSKVEGQVMATYSVPLP